MMKLITIIIVLSHGRIIIVIMPWIIWLAFVFWIAPYFCVVLIYYWSSSNTFIGKWQSWGACGKTWIQQGHGTSRWSLYDRYRFCKTEFLICENKTNWFANVFSRALSVLPNTCLSFLHYIEQISGHTFNNIVVLPIICLLPNVKVSVLAWS